MGDIIDMETGKPYKTDPESASETSVLDPAPMIGPGDTVVPIKPIRSMEERDRLNMEWLRKSMARRQRIRRVRIVFFLLTVIFGILQQWWAMLATLFIMLFTKTILQWLLKE